jgi:uridylate kinase
MENGSSEKLAYRRILLKLSGEALQGQRALGLDPEKLTRISGDIASIVQQGVQVGLVIGGGNIIRGADCYTAGVDRISADQMGMLATVINGLALSAALDKHSIPVKVFSALAIPGLVDYYDRRSANAALEQGYVTIFVGGTGNPLVTTDSAAALRGIEINADILIKATKVDGVFAADPMKNPDAKHFPILTYDQVIEQRLGVMDLNAILLCQEHGLPLRVFNMNQTDALLHIVLGQKIGTLIQSGGNSHE